MENMEFKGTKGKWAESKHGKGNISSAETGRMIAGCMGYTTNTDNGEHIEESLANAQLIIKAPEMLEALEEVLGKIDWSYESFGSTEGLIIKTKIEQLIKEATII